MLRCRSTGVHPDHDVNGTEDQVHEWWPEQAVTVLRAYKTVCEEMDGDICEEGEGEKGEQVTVADAGRPGPD